MTTKNTAPVKQQKTIKELLAGDKFKNEVAQALPKHLTPERFIRVALTALNRTPALQECTDTSFFQCLLDCSAMGLEPDGRRAHLIPYKRTCTLIIDYKGIVELVLRNGDVARIHADVVCENDIFEYDRGRITKHAIDFKQDRGEAYCVYAEVEFNNGTSKCEVMSTRDVEGIRQRSASANRGPWVSDWNEMAKKTVFKRLSKWLPLSPEVRDHIEKEDDREFSKIKQADAKPVAPLFGQSKALPEATTATEAADSIAEAVAAEPEQPVQEAEVVA